MYTCNLILAKLLMFDRISTVLFYIRSMYIGSIEQCVSVVQSSRINKHRLIFNDL